MTPRLFPFKRLKMPPNSVRMCFWEVSYKVGKIFKIFQIFPKHLIFIYIKDRIHSGVTDYECVCENCSQTPKMQESQHFELETLFPKWLSEVAPKLFSVSLSLNV